MIAGYLRPYWFSRGQCLSFYLEPNRQQQQVFVSFLDWLGEPCTGRPDPSHGLILENYTGSGVITDANQFLEWFASQKFGDALDDEAKDSIKRCADYAISHGCQMIEVADVYSPFGTCTNGDNARAHFLKNIDQ